MSKETARIKDTCKTKGRAMEQWNGVKNIGFHDARFDVACILKMVETDTELQNKVAEVWE